MNVRFNFLQDTFDSIQDEFDSIDDKKLNELIAYSLENKFYLSLILLDFTYLNKKFGYTAGDYLKEEFEKSLKKYLDSNVLYYTITSSKIFFFTKKPFKDEFKNEIPLLHEKLKNKNYDLGNKKVIFFIEKISYENKSSQNNFFEVNNTQDLVKMLNLALKEEFNLNEYRNYVQNYFNQLSKVNTVDKVKNLNEKFEKGFSQKDLGFEIKDLNSANFNEIYNKVKPLIQNSTYLTKAFKVLKENQENNYNDWNYYIIVFKNLIAKYLIWIEMQKLQIEGFKTEKVYTYFYRENPNIKEIPKDESIVRFDTKEGLKAWFDSVIRTLEHTYLNEIEKKRINLIRYNINNLNLDDRNDKLKFVKLVQNLFDSIHIKGLYNIPLEKVRPTEVVTQFFKNQLYLNFGSDYKNKYTIWRNSDFVKEGFYTFVKLPKLMNKTFDFFNLNKNNENLYLNLAFLEIDGFNAFNTYYFPNDTDSIIYSQILDKIYQVADSNLLNPNSKKQEFFSKLIISVMGDEFFFLIPTNYQISNEEKQWFEEYLYVLKISILNLAKDIKFYETAKINVSSNGTEVTFRKVLVDKEHFYQKSILLPIATLGVSGIVHYNIKYKEEDFENEITKLDNEMKLIKRNPKEKGKINIAKN